MKKEKEKYTYPFPGVTAVFVQHHGIGLCLHAGEYVGEGYHIKIF